MCSSDDFMDIDIGDFRKILFMRFVEKNSIVRQTHEENNFKEIKPQKLLLPKKSSS